MAQCSAVGLCAVVVGRGSEGEQPARSTLRRGGISEAKIGILAFALQCLSVSLYLLLIYSVH